MNTPRLQRRRVAPRSLPTARQSGFSLIEMVAAFVVFAIGMGVLLGILSASIRNARLSADYTQAALWAQTGLDVVGIGEELKEGRSSGRFDDEFRWELDVTKYEPPPIEGQPAPAGGGTEAFIGIELYRIDLEVLWGEGRNPRSAHFTTLRAVNPNPNGSSGLGGSRGGDMGQQRGNGRGSRGGGSRSNDKTKGG